VLNLFGQMPDIGFFAKKIVYIFSSMVKEEKEDFMVAHIVHSPSENEMCCKFYLQHISFYELR
jgi:hypothetical protein